MQGMSRKIAMMEIKKEKKCVNIRKNKRYTRNIVRTKK